MNNRDEFGKLIADLRKRRGISQKELAERLSVSASAVCKWEHGNNMPDVTMLSEMAEIFGVSCDDLHNPEQTLAKLAAFDKGGIAETEVEEIETAALQPEILPAESEVMCEEPEAGQKSAEVQQVEDGRKWKKGIWIAVGAMVLTVLIEIAGAIGWRAYLDSQEPYIVQGHYIEDAAWGKTYEIAVVLPKHFGLEEQMAYSDTIRIIFTQEQKIETNVVRARYYKDEEAALRWDGTEQIGYTFLDTEHEKYNY